MKLAVYFSITLISCLVTSTVFGAGVCGAAGSEGYCTNTTISGIYIRGDGRFNVTLTADLSAIQNCDPVDHTGYGELNVTVAPADQNYANLAQSIQLAASLGSTVTLQAVPGPNGRCELSDFIVSF